MIFNIYHIFTPFVKLRRCRFLYFFSLCDVRNEAVFLLLEHSSPRGVKQKKHVKNVKFWPLNPYYKRSNWKTKLAERYSEVVTSKLWNKKIHIYCQSLPKWSEIELYSLYGMIKSLWHIHSRDRHVEFTGKNTTWSAIPREQNHVAWLVKNDKTVFSKLTWKISLSVSGKQASRQASARPGAFLSQNFRCFPYF